LDSQKLKAALAAHKDETVALLSDLIAIPPRGATKAL